MEQQYEHLYSLLHHIPAIDARNARITPLNGGITNQNYRIDSGNESFVLRVAGKGTRLLGIDRAYEYACSSNAAQIGIGAEVIHFLPEEEVLVTRFIPGTGFTEEHAAQAEILPRIIASLRRCHEECAPFPSTFSPFETVRTYHTLAQEYGVAFPDTLPHVFALMQRIETALAPVQQIRPCHNDLLAGNFIDDGHMIRIIDWEYAGMGDLFFDLGNFAVNQSLDEAQCQFLLQSYFGVVSSRSADLAHLHLMRLSSDLRESFWGFLQLGISTLDFDYHAYAMNHLNRFLQNVETAPFEQWLQEISRDGGG